MKKILSGLVLLSALCVAQEDPLYYGEERTDFVVRWEYQKFCKHVYDPRTSIWRWPTNEEGGVRFHPRVVKPGDTIFVRNFPKFFTELAPHITVPYIIVSAGECLDKMKKKYVSYLDNEQVIAWFGIHANQSAIEHPKFHPIPIGVLQDPYHYQNRKKLNAYFKRLRTMAGKKYLLYMNFAEVEKPERQMLIKKFKQAPFVKHSDKIPFRTYLTEMAQSHFVLSPKGRAPDAYRTWEALLCGAIPVVKTSPLDCLYEGLPVLILDDWSQLTQEFLWEQYQRITAQKYDIAPLYTRYWTDKIREVQQTFLQGYSG